MRKGPASRFAYDPAVLVAYLDAHSEYKEGGHPNRRRHYIHRVPVAASDARIIRRWRNGQTEGVTRGAAVAMLGRHRLSLTTFETWAAAQGRTAVNRGRAMNTQQENT